ncbi:MAG: hypothetical protein AAFU85_18385 [Planctomycetota bacterium]
MKLFVAASCVVSLLPVTGCGVSGDSNLVDNYMEYEGQHFRTSKEYSDWDDFKEDPNNYLESETKRITDAVESVEFVTSARDRETVMKQMFDKQFPGFGCGQLGILDREQLDLCAAFSIEIPRTGKSRFAGYVNVSGQFILISDFVAPQTPMIAMVSVSDGHLNFHGMDKSIMCRDPISDVNKAGQ